MEVPVRRRQADRQGQAGQVDRETGKQGTYRGTDVGLADGWSGTGQVRIPRSRVAGRERCTTTGTGGEESGAKGVRRSLGIRRETQVEDRRVRQPVSGQVNAGESGEHAIEQSGRY